MYGVVALAKNAKSCTKNCKKSCLPECVPQQDFFTAKTRMFCETGYAIIEEKETEKEGKTVEIIKTFTQQFRVMDTDCDLNGRMMPGAFLRMAQQISTDHCEAIGMNREFYEKNQAVFLMVKMAMEWKRVPEYGEVLTLTTMPETAKKITYKRATVVKDQKGNQIGLLDSRWVLVDMNTHRIIRRTPQAFAELPFDEEVPFTLDMTLPKVQDTVPVGHGKAQYTYCDTNYHLNNTRYADIVCDALPLEQMKQKSVTQMTISYHNEIPVGHEFDLERAEVGENTWYIVGSSQGTRFFEALAKL